MLRAKCGTFVVVGFVQSDYRRCLGRYTYNIYVGLHCCWFAIMLCFPCKSCLRGLEFVCKAVLFCYFSKRWFQKCSWLTFRVFLTLLRLGSSTVRNILVNIGFKSVAVISKSISKRLGFEVR